MTINDDTPQDPKQPQRADHQERLQQAQRMQYEQRQRLTQRSQRPERPERQRNNSQQRYPYERPERPVMTSQEDRNLYARESKIRRQAEAELKRKNAKADATKSIVKKHAFDYVKTIIAHLAIFEFLYWGMVPLFGFECAVLPSIGFSVLGSIIWLILYAIISAFAFHNNTDNYDKTVYTYGFLSVLGHVPATLAISAILMRLLALVPELAFIWNIWIIVILSVVFIAGLGIKTYFMIGKRRRIALEMLSGSSPDYACLSEKEKVAVDAYIEIKKHEYEQRIREDSVNRRLKNLGHDPIYRR